MHGFDTLLAAVIDEITTTRLETCVPSIPLPPFPAFGPENKTLNGCAGRRDRERRRRVPVIVYGCAAAAAATTTATRRLLPRVAGRSAPVSALVDRCRTEGVEPRQEVLEHDIVRAGHVGGAVEAAGVRRPPFHRRPC